MPYDVEYTNETETEDPTETEIRWKCLQIQRTWTPEERLKRMLISPTELSIALSLRARNTDAKTL